MDTQSGQWTLHLTDGPFIWQIDPSSGPMSSLWTLCVASGAILWLLDPSSDLFAPDLASLLMIWPKVCRLDKGYTDQIKGSEAR